MKLHLTVIAGVLLALLSSCTGSYRDVKITSFEVASVSPNGLRSADALVRVGIHNPAGKFTIKDINGTIKRDSIALLVITAEDVKVDPDCDKEYPMVLSGKIPEGFSLLQLLPLLGGNGIDDLKVDLSAKAVVCCGIGKRVSYKDVPMRKLIEKGKKI